MIIPHPRFSLIHRDINRKCTLAHFNNKPWLTELLGLEAHTLFHLLPPFIHILNIYRPRSSLVFVYALFSETHTDHRVKQNVIFNLSYEITLKKVRRCYSVSLPLNYWTVLLFQQLGSCVAKIEIRRGIRSGACAGRHPSWEPCSQVWSSPKAEERISKALVCT